MGRREEAESRRHKTSPSPVRGEEDEEAIRKQLRESGWKKRRVDAENADPSKDLESPKAKADKSKSPSRVDDERRSSRKSRSSRRSRSPRRREREHRSSRRKESSRRRSPSRSRSRSPGHRRRHSSSRKRRSSRSPSRSKEKETKKRRSRSTSVKKAEQAKDEKEEKPDEKEEEREDRRKPSSSRKSSRRSRSGSPQSPSRSSRRRRHRRHSSYSRSASRGRRSRRGASRSRSRSALRDGRSRGRDRDRDRRSRRRRSPSRSRSTSYSRRRRKNDRSSSRDRPPRHEGKSSPEPHQQSPAATDADATATAPAAPGTAAAPAAGVNPTITQLMAQYPTLSLQEIIAKMQASNVTMAAAVAQKPARELYVGNLPPNVTGPQLQEFLSTIIQQVGLTTQPGNPIINTWISTDGHFAFCEMRSVEECNLALLLNQLSLLGQPLKFGRPRSFMGPPQPMPQISARAQTALTNLGCTPNPAWFSQPAVESIPGVATAPFSETSPAAATLATPATVPTVASAGTADTSSSAHRLIMSNIPVVLTEDQVKELVLPFGALKSFALVKDTATGASLGSALFEYEDDDVAAQAVEGLNGLSIGGILLSVQRQPPSSSAAVGVLPIAVLNPEDQPSPVLKMTNMVSVDELRDDDEYADLAEDVEEECKRFGSVTGMEIPRPKDGEEVPGLGCIYVRFGKEEDAVSALKALNGRKFGGNIVKVTYFPVDKFDKREFS